MPSLRSFVARQVMFPPRGRIPTLFHVQLALQGQIARRSPTHFHLAVTCRGLPLPCCGGPILNSPAPECILSKGASDQIANCAVSPDSAHTRQHTPMALPLRSAKTASLWLRSDRREEIRASAIQLTVTLYAQTDALSVSC